MKAALMRKDLKNRQRYLDEALMFRDTDLIKVVTGVRRCGKSSLLALVRNALESEQVKGRSFVGLHRRSEERRVGKECRSRWSPYH